MITFWLLFNEKIVLILLIYGVVMGKLRSIFYGKMVRKQSGGIFLNIINLIGTPVHEFGHLIFAVVFGMEITEVCLYRTLRQAQDGRLGYVNVRMKTGGIGRFLWNTIGSFFVGIGPLFMGPAVIFLGYQFLPQTMKTTFLLYKEPLTLLKQMSQFGVAEWFILLLFLYAMIGISLNLELSKADILMAWKGFVAIEIFVLLVSVLLFEISYPYLGILNQVSGMVLVMSAIGAVGGVIGAFLA